MLHVHNIIYYILGVTISGLNHSLTVGTSATIRCMTNIPVTSMKWMDAPFDMLINAIYKPDRVGVYIPFL